MSPLSPLRLIQETLGGLVLFVTTGSSSSLSEFSESVWTKSAFLGCVYIFVQQIPLSPFHYIAPFSLLKNHNDHLLI